MLEKPVQKYQHKAALITDEGCFTYSQLTQERNSISTYMQSCGVRVGDRIIMLLPHCRFLVSSNFAASKLGATYTLLHESTTRYQLDYIIKDSQASYLLTTDTFNVKLELASNIGTKVILDQAVTTDEMEQRILY
ncbi:long-chain fatty acid--CoA ligase [Paenibacillus sp. MZ03-122A]|nr:long-chain fatty acid--CoA ligase [Paenibacillus sp. MZ03-122A]